MSVRIGIDIGGTKTKILMISPEGKVLAMRKIKTDGLYNPGPVVDRSGDEVEKLLKAKKVKPSQVESVAVGIAGFSNPHTGVIDISPNLHWYKVPFKKMMEDRLGYTVYMANDVNAAAWGEFVYGAGKGANEMLSVFIGSGIGGGIVSNSRLVEGATGTAGEVGHTTHRVNGIKCSCGQRGCFEAYGGGVLMENRVRKAVKKGHGKKMLEMAGNDPEKINTKVIRLAAEAGDPLAAKVWGEAVESYVTLCSNLTSIFNPDRIVLGGGVVTGNPGIIETVREGVKKRAVSLSAERVKIVKSKLGDNAVAMGAAALVDLYRK